ncbi:hypothetical protein GCM10023307_11060 [Lysobacter hankyongensis]|uniref:Uncharacterized protein n=2 Tax=Lysobacter hankyongensis TaxID=1176535 RepID=A0ABP9AXZ4_9GAMM
MRDLGRASSITPSMQDIKMKNEQDRVLGRTLAVEETAAVCGAERQAPTTTMYDSATKSDNTVPVVDTTSPITD